MKFESFSHSEKEIYLKSYIPKDVIIPKIALPLGSNIFSEISEQVITLTSIILGCDNDKQLIITY